MLWRKYSGIEADFSERQAGRKISLTPATGKAHYLLLAGMMSTSFASRLPLPHGEERRRWSYGTHYRSVVEVMGVLGLLRGALQPTYLSVSRDRPR